MTVFRFACAKVKEKNPSQPRPEHIEITGRMKRYIIQQ